MERKRSTRKKRKLIIVLSVLLTLMIALILTAVLIIDSYLSKINRVIVSDTSKDNSLQLILAEEMVKGDYGYPDKEEVDRSITDSPKERINFLEDEIGKNMEANSKSILFDEEVFNILLIGTDTRIVGDTGRSDAMLLVSVNKRTERIIVTSILRDIYLSIPGKKNNRLNAAYAFGGADLLMETIEQNFKITIDRFVSVDFYAFIDLVNVIGGVTIEVTQEELPVINNYINEMNLLSGEKEDKDYLTIAGSQLLNGKQALGYVRNRYTGNSDFERTARQRRLLKQIFGRVKEAGIIELNDMLQRLLPQITTNLTEGELFTLILSLPSYIKYDTEQWSIPMSGTYSSERIRGMAVLGIDFEKNVSQLHDKVYDTP